jgi:phosphoglycerate kinase
VSGKIDVIEALLPKVDTLVVGGGMAFTFYKAQGKEIGGSLVEEDRVEMAKALLAKAGPKLVLPVDTGRDRRLRLRRPQGRHAQDRRLGQDRPEGHRRRHRRGDTREVRRDREGGEDVVWNGPMGVFEIDATGQGHARGSRRRWPDAYLARRDHRSSAAATPLPQSRRTASRRP